MHLERNKDSLIDLKSSDISPKLTDTPVNSTHDQSKKRLVGQSFFASQGNSHNTSAANFNTPISMPSYTVVQVETRQNSTPTDRKRRMQKYLNRKQNEAEGQSGDLKQVQSSREPISQVPECSSSSDARAQSKN